MFLRNATAMVFHFKFVKLLTRNAFHFFIRVLNAYRLPLISHPHFLDYKLTRHLQVLKGLISHFFF